MSETLRRLTAVMVADVHGYTRLMEFDEETTRRTLNQHRERFRTLAGHFGGRVVDSSGDSMLAEFVSVCRAVEFAAEFQSSVAAFNSAISSHERMEYRIGITVGDVLDDRASIYGDAVNTAARIQALAPTGGVCVSGVVRELVEGRLKFGFQFLREQRVKNRSRSVRVFQVLMEARPDLRGLSGSNPARPWLGDEPGIAVLPFHCLGADGDAQYLGDGIAEDIITELSRFSTIHVMARTTSFSYRNEPGRLQKLRDELNVQYALEGSIRSVGKRIRISVQLIDCDTGKPIWGDRYTHASGAIFDVQDEVVGLIVGMLEARLIRDRSQTLDPGNRLKGRAYDLCLRGNRLLERGTIDAAAQAEILLRKAIDNDPGFARAYSGLASSCYLRASLSPGTAAWRTDIQQALSLSRTAVELSPNDGRAHANRGWGYMLTRNFDEAERCYDLAGDLNPNDADILLARGRAASLLGDAATGFELGCRALRLNPVHPRYYFEHMGEIRFFSRQFKDCVDIHTANAPMSLESAAILAAAYGHLGDDSSARRVADGLLKLFRDSWRGGESMPDVGRCLDWLERIIPVRNTQDRLLLINGLEVAGLYRSYGAASGVDARLSSARVAEPSPRDG